MYPLIVIAGFKIQTYYVILSLISSMAILYSYFRSIKLRLNKELILDLSLVLTLSGFLGARLFHIFFEEPFYYFSKPLEVFSIFNGGYVFYGGLIFAILAGMLFVRWKKQGSNLGKFFDFYAPVISISYAFGRWACFFAGCCYGKYCNYLWAIQGRHPTQIYFFLSEFFIYFGLIFVEKKKPNWLQKSGDLFALWLVLHAISRLIVEQFRADFRGPEYFLSISSWISLLLILIAILFLFSKKKSLAN